MKTTFKIAKTPANARKILKLSSFIKTINFDNMQEYIELAQKVDVDPEYEHSTIHQSLQDYNNHCVFFCKNNNTRRALVDYFEDPQQVAVFVDNMHHADRWSVLNCGFEIIDNLKKLQKYSHVIIDNVSHIDPTDYQKLYFGKSSLISLINYSNIVMQTQYSSGNFLSSDDNILLQYVYEKQKSNKGKIPYRYLDNRNILSNKLLNIKEKADLLSFHGFLDLDIVFGETFLTFEQLKLFIGNQKESCTCGVYSDDLFKNQLNKIKKIKIAENPEIVIVQRGHHYDSEILKSQPVYVIVD